MPWWSYVEEREGHGGLMLEKGHGSIMLGKGHGGLYKPPTKEERKQLTAKRRERSDQVQ